MSLVMLEWVIPNHLRRREQGMFFQQSKPESEKHAKKERTTELSSKRERERKKRERQLLLSTGVGILTNFPFVTHYVSEKILHRSESSFEKTVTFQDCFSH